MGSSKLLKAIAVVALMAMCGLIAYKVLTMPDKRNGAEKLGDAIHDLPQGIDKASRQLEDRTPGQRIGDAIKDATQPESSDK